MFVRLSSPEAPGQLSERDLQLARSIFAAARQAGAEADPSAVQYVQITLDALDAPMVMPFWRAILGYDEVGSEDLLELVNRPDESGGSFLCRGCGKGRR